MLKLEFLTELNFIFKNTINHVQNFKNRYYPLLLLLFHITCFFSGMAQKCPPNIDFETGTFDGWTCYTGNVFASGSDNIISLSNAGGAVYNRHTMYAANTGALDYYGNFPVSCPNGSGHSIKLGNNSGGAEAEGISYEFTIPANQNSYSLLYYYAVVFQAPNHRENEQPRMEIEVTNVTDNIVISCASFTFISVGTSLPGFQVSNQSDTIPVLYKDWSPVSVDLSGNAGKTIRMFFKTADCTFKRHFGYAYIDVNTECSGTFAGATYCPDDTLINVVAPHGYEGYTWYDSSLTRVLGNTQVLTLAPPPPSGTTLAVKLDPYNGYGCPNTLFTKLKDSLTIMAYAGKDTLSCNLSPVNIGTNPKTGLIYQWTPAAGLNNPAISNPVATPAVTTSYIVATTNAGGGCRTTDTVLVKASLIDDSLYLTGKSSFCVDNGDSAVLNVKPTNFIQWFVNDKTINGANKPAYKVTTSGSYSALLINAAGCEAATPKKPVVMEKAKAGVNYSIAYAVINLPLDLRARPIGETVLWSPGVNLNDAKSFTPVFTGASQYLYTVSIKTVTECLTVDTQLVKIIPKIEIYVPNAFTPNHDGKNDFLRPLVKGIKDVRHFRIYNRWGTLVFERQDDEMPGWDGTYKGVPLQTQTMVWMLECVGVDNTVYTQKGSTLLLR
ncbi:MAG: gliding motility-associated C-terminal protein [Ferruginibacter sp.]|nr:gliding motility-associated C-terminal protein [Ferruginibacter sp.]